MENLKLFFHPSFDEINSFLPELKREYKVTGHGMYCNWDTIISRLKKDQIITLHLNDKPIALLTWYRNDKVVEMEIIWTLLAYRGKGYGLRFQELLFKEFKKRGDVAITLFCATKDGLSLAKRSEFTPQYNCGDFSNENIPLGLQAAYIKILRNTDALFYENEDIVILCYEECGNENSFYGEWCLSADFMHKPVYWYVNESWECKIVYKGKIIRETSMKHILYDLKIPTYNYLVAYIDKNIIIPKHWFK